MKQVLLISCIALLLSCQEKNEEKHQFRITTSDTALQQVIDWAQPMALSYVGNATDSVGPWYEASLPQRQAFCMRDVSHQSGGAEILGLSKENFNMFEKFAANISESKDWCTYWEINKDNLPAPVDYRNDKEFWYNLNANFDVLDACYRTYLWTGDRRYIDDPVFLYFYEKTMTDYIEHWDLQADSIMNRPQLMHSPEPFDKGDSFHTCRGLPSYVENVEGLTVTADLIASIYRACISYAQLLNIRGETAQANRYKQKAEAYRTLFESEWWDQATHLYHTFWTTSNAFQKGEGETFILWFGIAETPERINNTIKHLVSLDLNVENLSYFPKILYQYNYNREAYDKMIRLSKAERNEYPEVSYGIIEGIVAGTAGIKVDAVQHKITTVSRLTDETKWIQIEHLPVLSGRISVKHESTESSSFENNTDKELVWKAMFPGQHSTVYVQDKAMETKIETDILGNTFTFVEIAVSPNSKKTVKINNP